MIEYVQCFIIILASEIIDVFIWGEKRRGRISGSEGGDLQISKENIMEWKKAFDRIMDQLYNHPEEMRTRLLGKYNTPVSGNTTEGRTAIEILQSMQRA